MTEPGQLLGEVLVRLQLARPAQVEAALERARKTGERIGQALVALGHLTPAQLETGLLEALGLRRAQPTPKLGEILVRLRHVTQAQVDEALARQKTHGGRLGELLVQLQACGLKQVYEALSLQSKATQPDSGPGEGPTRVMVVDDSDIARTVIEQGLTGLGYEVVAVDHPARALELARASRPSIVLTDLTMPQMDGAELCRQLKGIGGRAVPVIILTANDEDAQRVGGLRAGADDYVSKGASLEELAARIDGVVRRSGETERVRHLFARYTSDAVVDEALSRGNVVLTGEKREVTVLFADIRNFTHLAEAVPPEQVVGVLNLVLEKLADAVLTCGGTLDKFLGDGVMALFGAPVSRPDDALRAVQAAELMMSSLVDLRNNPHGPRELELGIGINTGVVIAGTFGSLARTEYTCIGDSVNVASRLCGVAGGGEILCGERTVQRVGAGRFEALAPVRLKGKAQDVSVWRVKPSILNGPGRHQTSHAP